MKIEAKPIVTTPSAAKAKIARTSSKTTKTSRKVSQTISIYGEELFLESVRKEREVVIHFSNFNKHKLRFSDDGEFIIGYKFIDYDTEIFTLYHCLESVEYSEEIAELEMGDKISKFDFSSIYEVKDQISKIVKDDLWQEKQVKIKAQKEADEINRRLEEDRKNKEELELEKADSEYLNGQVTVETTIITEIVETTTEVEEEIEQKIEEELIETPTFFKHQHKFVVVKKEPIVEEVVEEKPVPIAIKIEPKQEAKPKFAFTLRKDK